MSDDDGPWSRNGSPKRTGLPIGLILWLGLLVAVGLGVWKLSELFPGQITTDWDRAYLLQAIIIIAFLSTGIIFVRRIHVREFVRNVAIWLGIAAVLLVGLSFRSELEGLALRLRSELVPGYAVTTDNPNELVLTESSDGHFFVIGQANGVRVRFLIDMGASDTVLSPSDAASLGIDLGALNFNRVYSTANGLGRGAPFILESLAVGPIEFSNMPVSVNQAEMGSSLLGMTFLRRLKSYEVQDRRLFLRSR